MASAGIFRTYTSNNSWGNQWGYVTPDPWPGDGPPYEGTSLLDLEGDEDSMANEYSSARDKVRGIIEETLTNSDDVLRTWITNERTGPMGGVSNQVDGYIELEDGTIAPFTVNIYSDHNISDKLEDRLDREEQQATLRKRLKG